MMGKRKRMIMFAVVASIIVAVPITFISIVPSAKSFSVVDGNVYQALPANMSLFTHTTDDKKILLNSSSMAYQGNYTDLSYFNASMFFLETYMCYPSGGAYTIFIDYNFRGIFSSNLHPTDVAVTVSAFYQNNTSDNNFVVTTPFPLDCHVDPYENNVSTSFSDTCIWERGSGTVNYSLENSSSFNNKQKYYFWLANGGKPASVNGFEINSTFPRGFWIYYNPPIVYNLTIDLTFKVTSTSATLMDNFTVYVIDTGINGE